MKSVLPSKQRPQLSDSDLELADTVRISEKKCTSTTSPNDVELMLSQLSAVTDRLAELAKIVHMRTGPICSADKSCDGSAHSKLDYKTTLCGAIGDRIFDLNNVGDILEDVIARIQL